MYYIFQESEIWTSGDPVDDSRKPIKIRAKTEIAARKKLPSPDGGRVWVLVAVKKRPKVEQPAG